MNPWREPSTTRRTRAGATAGLLALVAALLGITTSPVDAAVPAGNETQGNGNTYVLADSEDAEGPESGGPILNPTTDSGVSDSDDATAADLPIGFSFEFYGTTYTEFSIRTNGFLFFDDVNGGTAFNSDLATSNAARAAAIFGWWDDLHPGECGAIEYDTFGTPGEQVLVVEWNDVCHISATTNGITFQIRLYEGSNAIEVEYFDTDFGNATYNRGASATVGVRNGTAGDPYLQYSSDSAALDNDLVIRFWQAECMGETATIVGTRGHDDVNGTNGDDVIYGHLGDDTIVGGPGDDRMCGNEGDDAILGGEGNDRIAGNDGNDGADGGIGDDVMFGGMGNDQLVGGDGNDVMQGNAGDDFLDGGEGNDRMFGAAGDDTMHGREGNDIMAGNQGDDTMTGEEGDDRMFAGAGTDNVDGGIGDDGVAGNDGPDTVIGGDGDDTVNGGADDDPMVDGGNGNDLVVGIGGDDTITGGPGADKIGGGLGNDTINAGGGNDIVWAGPGNDTVLGGPDEDRIGGGPGNDDLDGEAGADFINGGPDTDICTGGTGVDSLTATCETATQ